MNKQTSLLVNNQVPDFVRNDYPKFIEFMEAYYKFLDQYTIRFDEARDVDLCAEDFVFFLRQEFASKFPTAQINDRKLIKIIRNLYNSKGTVNAVELLFRIFFNEAVVVRQPGKNILRASDGRWLFENSITLRQIYGEMDINSNIQLKVENANGIFYIDVDRVEILDAETTRCFYRNNSNIVFETDENAFQTIEIVDQTMVDIDSIDGFQEILEDGEQIIDVIENGVIVYRGKLIKSPAYLEIITPGRDWRKGQVFFVEGEEKDSLARVVDVGPNGEMTAVEIYEYGRGHAEDQLVVVSPYPNKPGNVTYDITSLYRPIKGVLATAGDLPVSPNNNDAYITDVVADVGDLYIYRTDEWVFSGTVDSGITSFIDNTVDIDEAEGALVLDSVLGVTSIIDSSSYYGEAAENAYTTQDYNGVTAFFNKTSVGSSANTSTLIDPDLTVEEYYASRTTLFYRFDYAIKYRGIFQSDEGQLSNPNIRLQDNYFYQMFSYVLETLRGIDEYRSTLNLIHPAGLKFFGDLTKVALLVLPENTAIRAISQDTAYYAEFLDAFDIDPDLWITKVLPQFGEDPHEVLPEDLITSLVAIKNLTETRSATEVIKFVNTKLLEDLTVDAENSDSLSKTVTSLLLDSIVVRNNQDTFPYLTTVVTKVPTTDTISGSDALITDINKNTTDTATPADTGTTFEEIYYEAESYSEGSYVSIEKTLTLG